MKKILILFLAIIIICTGIGFAATSTPKTGNPVNIANDSGSNDPVQDYGAPSTNTAQNNGDKLDDNIGENELSNGDSNSDDNWYDGFWGDGKKIDKKEDNKDRINIVINNFINTEANGGSAASEGGNSVSGIETKSASSNVPQQFASEIAETNGVPAFNKEIPMQKTGLPVVPALLSILLISSGILYRILRK